MHDPTAFTRREFLAGSMALASTVATVPGFLLPASRAMAAPKPGDATDRILVVVQLSGGNDGLNTVVPFAAREYYDARPRIAVPESDVLRLGGASVGLHPEMVDLKAMYDDGLVSIVQGVGYPNPNRSHFVSMDIYHTADVRGGRGLGWVGQALDAVRRDQQGRIDATACIAIGGEAPLATQGRHVQAVTFENANLFRWVGSSLHDVLGAQYDALNRAGDLIDPDAEQPTNQAAFVMRTSLDAQLASDRIRKAVAQGTTTAFPGGPLSNQLRMVASMIRAELPTRVYYVGLGGFDTHANQPFAHSRNLRLFSEAVRAFYSELKAIGQDQRVLTMAFSEFGRRVEQNGSNGTDHGTAGPMFLFGDMVRPGVIGEHPSMDELDGGDLVYTADFRSIYAAVLANWMKIDAEAVLGRAYRPAHVLDAKKVG